MGSSYIIILPIKDKCVNVIQTTPTPIPHHQYRTTKPLVLNVQPYLVYNHMFHCRDIVVAFCYCTYHAYCLVFHMWLSTNVGGSHAVHHLIQNGRSRVWDSRWDKIFKKVSALNLYFEVLYVCKVASIIYKDLQFWNVLHKSIIYIVW